MDENEARESARKKYLATIESLWTESDACPICGNHDWNIANLVEVPIRRLTPELLAERQGYVFVPVGCLTCGYTMLFHSGTLDAVEGRDKAEEK